MPLGGLLWVRPLVAELDALADVRVVDLALDLAADFMVDFDVDFANGLAEPRAEAFLSRRELAAEGALPAAAFVEAAVEGNAFCDAGREAFFVRAGTVDWVALDDFAAGAATAGTKTIGAPVRQTTATKTATAPNNFIRLSQERLILATNDVVDQSVTFIIQ